MARILMIVLGFFLESAVKRVLVGAGISLVSGVGMQKYFDYKLSQAISQTGQMDNWILGLMAIAKLDTCICIILGALSARAVLSASALTLSKLK